MDVDGNGWSGRFHRLMSMKACVLKSTLFPEWCVSSLHARARRRCAAHELTLLVPSVAGTATASSPGSSASPSSSAVVVARLADSLSLAAQLRPRQGRLLGPVRHHDVLPRHARRQRCARRARQEDRHGGQALGARPLAQAGHGRLHVCVPLALLPLPLSRRASSLMVLFVQSAFRSSGPASCTATTTTRARSTLSSGSTERRSPSSSTRPPRAVHRASTDDLTLPPPPPPPPPHALTRPTASILPHLQLDAILMSTIHPRRLAVYTPA